MNTTKVVKVKCEQDLYLSFQTGELFVENCSQCVETCMSMFQVISANVNFAVVQVPGLMLMVAEHTQWRRVFTPTQSRRL
jgi:hypothetical protein